MEVPKEDFEVTRMTARVDKIFNERVARTLNMEEFLKKKQEHVESKKHSLLVGLDLRLLCVVSDEWLIEAADEGNRGQVWKLLRGGVIKRKHVRQVAVDSHKYGSIRRIQRHRKGSHLRKGLDQCQDGGRGNAPESL
jgi:hypothetical protein